MGRTVGQRVQALREQRRWTIGELAERAKIPYMTLYRLETGKHKEPLLHVAVQLAQALGVSLDVVAGVYAGD